MDLRNELEELKTGVDSGEIAAGTAKRAAAQNAPTALRLAAIGGLLLVVTATVIAIVVMRSAQPEPARSRRSRSRG